MSDTVTLPPAVRAVLRIGSQPSARRLSFYPGESVRVVARFTDELTKLPVQVDGVGFTFVRPSGLELVVDAGDVQQLVAGDASQWFADILADDLGSWEVRVSCAALRPGVDVLWFDILDRTQASGDRIASPLIGVAPNTVGTSPAGEMLTVQSIVAAPDLGELDGSEMLYVARGQMGGRTSVAALKDVASAAAGEVLSDVQQTAAAAQQKSESASSDAQEAKNTASEAHQASSDATEAAAAAQDASLAAAAAATAAQQTADAAIPAEQRAAAGGVATLDGGAKVPFAQIPTGTANGTVAAGDDERFQANASAAAAAQAKATTTSTALDFANSVTAVAQYVSATAVPVGTPDGTSKTFALKADTGATIGANAAVTSLVQSDWQGAITLKPYLRTNAIRASASIYNGYPTSTNYWHVNDSGTTYLGPGVASYDVASPDGSATAVTKITAVNTAKNFARHAGMTGASGETHTTTFWVYIPGGQSGLSGAIFNTSWDTADTSNKVTVTQLDAWVRVVCTSLLTAARTSVYLAAGSLSGGALTAGQYFYVTFAQDEVAVEAGAYIPTGAAPVSQVDYVVNAIGTLTLAQAPAASANLRWTGWGSVYSYIDRVISFDTMARMRAGLPAGHAGPVYVKGALSVGDGGEGLFYPSTGTLDNGGTHIVDAKGRQWVRAGLNGAWYVDWFGCYGDGATDDSVAILKCLAQLISLKGAGTVRFGNRRYYTTQTVLARDNIQLAGVNGLTGDPALGMTGSWIIGSATLSTVIQAGYSTMAGSCGVKGLSSGRISAPTVTPAIGILAYGGKYSVLEDVFSYNHTQGVVLRASPVGIAPRLSRVDTGAISDAHFVFDGVPEIRGNLCRVGRYGAVACDCFIRVQGGTASNSASGPNTLFFTNSHFNQSAATSPVNYAISFVNLAAAVGTIDARIWSFGQCYWEGVTGAFIHSDTSWNILEPVLIVASAMNLPSAKLFDLDYNTRLRKVSIGNSWMAFGDVTLDSYQVAGVGLNNNYLQISAGGVAGAGTLKIAPGMGATPNTTNSLRVLGNTLWCHVEASGQFDQGLIFRHNTKDFSSGAQSVWKCTATGIVDWQEGAKSLSGTLNSSGVLTVPHGLATVSPRVAVRAVITDSSGNYVHGSVCTLGATNVSVAGGVSYAGCTCTLMLDY